MKNIKYLFLLLILITSKFNLYAVRPEEVLPDHVNGISFNENTFVRKGSIFAAIKTCELIDNLSLANKNFKDEPKLKEALKDLNDLIPSLKQLQLFNFFTPYEYINQNPYKEGRIFLGVLYLQQFPSEADKKVISKLNELTKNKNISKYLKAEIQKSLNKINNL